jgi:Core-2/I-Branching enzyme
MKIAYLITAYDNPSHLGRLLDAILTPQSAAYIHIDGKFPIEPFEHCRRDKVHFLQDRVRIYWGEFSMVEATLRLMRAALRSPERFDYLMLISGTDYPIRPATELEAFLEANAGTQFMNMVEMPNDTLGKPLARLQRYKLQTGERLGGVRRRIRAALVKAGLMPAARNYQRALGARRPFGGSTWWTLTREACEYILDFVSRERAFVRFYRYSVIPDEGMFHTIIGNSQFAHRVRRNLGYTDWRACGNHPELIGPDHVRRFVSEPNVRSDDKYGPGKIFFARKFSDRAATLVDELEAHLKSRAQPSVSADRPVARTQVEHVLEHITAQVAGPRLSQVPAE